MAKHRRHKMTKHRSKRVFKKFAGHHKKNTSGANMSMRGGIRL